MKKILLDYYSRKNFGDDLFVQLFCDSFRNHKIYIMGNPLYIPRGLGKNVHIPLSAWLTTIAGKLQALFPTCKNLVRMLGRIYAQLMDSMRKKVDACVTIGGSIFPDTPSSSRDGQLCIDFSVPADIQRDYRLNSTKRSNHNQFVIGANLGPVYHDTYFSHIKHLFSSYAHVCLRDYASYYPFKDDPHVQYAPDVVFMHTPKKNDTPADIKRVIISVMDISKHTVDADIVISYYALLKETIAKLQSSNVHITLLSLCKREGDSDAAMKLLQMLDSQANVDIYTYNGNLKETLGLFESASFIIGTRFHSMIVGFVYGKPVFPIAYGCKMEHYLQDLSFEGKYVALDALPHTTVEDVLYNYKNHILCDCKVHQKYAPNQFEVLKQYLAE